MQVNNELGYKGTMENTKNLPRVGTAARAVLMAWEVRGGIATWATLEAVYMSALRRTKPRKRREHCTSNLARLLRRYGTKLGPRNSRTPWQLKVTNALHPPVNSGAQVQGEMEAFVEAYFCSATA